jgi:hypothetical protein
MVVGRRPFSAAAAPVVRLLPGAVHGKGPVPFHRLCPV